MKVTSDDVEHVATLANLELSSEELATFTAQLDSILTFFEKLQELDTEGIEPTFQISVFHNPFREDKVEPSISEEDALKNAPEKDNGYFKVPKVIG